MKMYEIWKMKVDEMQEIINSVEVGKDGRLMQLYKKKLLLEDAFNRCMEVGK